jgi:hypothetical protein
MNPRDDRPNTAVAERPAPPAPRGAPRTPNPEDLRRSQGVRDLVGGAVLIGIGFLFGSSIFIGNATTLDWIFDGLGIFWIAKGIYLLATAKPTASV